MRRTIIAAACLALVFGLAAPARADLNGFLATLNVEARADLPGFAARVAAQFGVAVGDVDAIIRVVDTPADAFMCYQVGYMTHQRPAVVVDAYKGGKGKGWGVIAQQLGIKPGSAEFKALKDGKFKLTGKPMTEPGKGKDKGKGPKK